MTRPPDGSAPYISPGVLPVDSPAPDTTPPRSNAATAATAASVRALAQQTVAFYFRAPVKAFFRTRVDYLAWARATQSPASHLLSSTTAAASSSASTTTSLWTWLRGTTPGVLGSAIRTHGWAVVPEQILPPLIANVGVGAVLYTSYLQILGRLHNESGRATRRVYPPPEPTQTFAAGFLAGSIQSVVAAPLDAIQARYDHREHMGEEGRRGGRPKSMWKFGREKLSEIGARGIFAGWGLSFVKDSFGSAVFFSVFEGVKAQGYYEFVRWYYGGLDEWVVDMLARRRPAAPTSGTAGSTKGLDTDIASAAGEDTTTAIRPHYAIEPMFLLAAGVSASLAQQVLLHPLNHIQVQHWDNLEELDAKAARLRECTKPQRRWRMMRLYYRAYQETWAQCLAEAKAEGVSVRKWLYRGFWWNSIRQVPGTSAGLIIFELVRRKYGLAEDEVRINRDGYDILLN